MPASVPAAARPLALICGDDDLSVKKRARSLFEQWTRQAGGYDHEIIDGAAANTTEALAALAKLREALQTLPFFGTTKVIWLRNCTFLGEERTAQGRELTEALGRLAQELKTLDWSNVRLLVSAGKVDKRRSFYKTLETLGSIEHHDLPSLWDEDWPEAVRTRALQTFKELGRQIAPDALNELIERVGPNPHQLDNEIEKLTLYVGERTQIGLEDVTTICSRNPLTRAFALGDALGERDLAGALRHLGEEIAAMSSDREKSEIGLLYGLIAKVRLLLLARELVRAGWVSPEMPYARFKAALERIPPEQLPDDPKYNPCAQHPWPLYRALSQSRHYTADELVRALEILLQCNRDLVSRQLDEALLLQHALVRIIGTTPRPQPRHDRALAPAAAAR